MNDRYITPAEAADTLRVSSDTVHRLIASGELPALRVSARIVRIPVPAFEAFQAGRATARRRVVRRSRSSEVVLGTTENLRDPQPA